MKKMPEKNELYELYNCITDFPRNVLNSSDFEQFVNVLQANPLPAWLMAVEWVKSGVERLAKAKVRRERIEAGESLRKKLWSAYYHAKGIPPRADLFDFLANLKI
jgi:hypothetical protein